MLIKTAIYIKYGRNKFLLLKILIEPRTEKWKPFINFVKTKKKHKKNLFQRYELFV